MIEYAGYYDSQYRFCPLSEIDKMEAQKYPQRVTLEAKVKGTERQRSIQQHRWFHKMMRITAENARDGDWNHIEKVKIRLKVMLEYRDPNIVVVMPDGRIEFKYRSFSMQDLKQFEANDIFNKGMEIMAEYLGCTEQELLTMAKQS